MPTREDILNTTEEVLRRFGLEKTNVVDVARALDVSHSTIYRHFSSKDELRNAVVRRWLQRVERPLATIRSEEGPAKERLYRWLVTLATTKQEKRRDDPEMFATYYQLARAATETVDDHVSTLIDQLTVIVEDGRQEGIFSTSAPRSAARAVFYATSRFHHPVRAETWDDPDIWEQFETVWHLVFTGLKEEG